MKKLIALYLVIVSMFLMVQPVAAVAADPLEPRYVNVSNATVSLSISSSGVAQIKIYCYGNSCIESITTTTYLQKKVDGSWKSIKIWGDSSTNTTFTQAYTYQLSEHGEYRVLTYFRCTGTTNETISATSTKTY